MGLRRVSTPLQKRKQEDAARDRAMSELERPLCLQNSPQADGHRRVVMFARCPQHFCRYQLSTQLNVTTQGENRPPSPLAVPVAWCRAP